MSKKSRTKKNRPPFPVNRPPANPLARTSQQSAPKPRPPLRR
jgi:hypothetical protein